MSTKQFCKLPYPAINKLIFLSFILYSSFFLSLHCAFMFLTPRGVEPRAPSLCCWHPTRSPCLPLFNISIRRPLTSCLPVPSFPAASLRVPSRRPAQPTTLSSQPSSASRAPSPASLPYTQPRPSLQPRRLIYVVASSTCKPPRPYCMVSPDSGPGILIQSQRGLPKRSPSCNRPRSRIQRRRA